MSTLGRSIRATTRKSNLERVFQSDRRAKMNPPYSDPGPLLSQADIETAERRIGVQLPPVVQRLYLASNGGSPEPYVFSDENIDTVVSEFLQLTGGSRGTALECYQRLVEKKKLTPAHFVPFGVDGG